MHGGAPNKLSAKLRKRSSKRGLVRNALERSSRPSSVIALAGRASVIETTSSARTRRRSIHGGQIAGNPNDDEGARRGSSVARRVLGGAGRLARTGAARAVDARAAASG